MKVQTKITLLLLFVVATFVAALFGFRAYERFKFRKISEERFTERKRSFQEFLERRGEPLDTFVDYFGIDDQMVEAIKKIDHQWLGANIDTSKLDSYGANAIWICDAQGQVIHPIDNLQASQPLPLPVPVEALASLFARKSSAHFFVVMAQGFMEIGGGTVHPSKDSRGESPTYGYMFAGRLWSTAELGEMHRLTDNIITLAPPDEQVQEIHGDEQSGAVQFTRALNGWDNKPIKQLVVRSDSRVVQEFNRSSRELLLWMIVFALALLLLISSALVRWVRRPLRAIMSSLKSHDPEPIRTMLGGKSEFGELARTVDQFFQQRDILFREIEDRRATEAALRAKEDELRHSHKMEAVGRLAGGVAHDFNNLLTAIIGYAELLSERDSVEPLVKQHADLIRRAGERAATLTRQLLAFSRKQLLQPIVIDLNALVVDMENLLRRVIGERFRLQTRPGAGIGRVKADPSQLEQVVLNLGVNARDAMPAGGTLVIGTENVHLDGASARQISPDLREGEYVVLFVSDDGTGMDDETKARIFEPFFTTKGPGKGTGLGLATVYGIVRQTGGGISVESELGRGTTFRIYLPLEYEAVDATRPPTIDAERTNNSETILVVEDDEIVRELVCAVLSDYGYNVIYAPDGRAAIETAEGHDGVIDLLVTDVIMPHMNGPELAARLATPRPEMKVLYVSGYSANDIGDHGVLEPHIELLQKPFTPQALARKVREVLRDGYHWSNRVRDDASQLRLSI